MIPAGAQAVIVLFEISAGMLLHASVPRIWERHRRSETYIFALSQCHEKTMWSMIDNMREVTPSCSCSAVLMLWVGCGD